MQQSNINDVEDDDDDDDDYVDDIYPGIMLIYP